MEEEEGFKVREAIFTRVGSSYDLALMEGVRIMGIGCGGATQFYEEMARCGIGEFVLIDPDVVELSNLGTQQTYLDEVGFPKVEVIAKRLSRINPYVRVSTNACQLEEISDSEFEDLAFKPLRPNSPPNPGTPEPKKTLLCGMTDNFYTQARVNRLALQYGMPCLCCQLYQEGLAGEITFTYPGVTPACHRCMLNPRYKAYLEWGYQNTVTSEGAPIFATTRINALCGMVALALLHHGTSHLRWGQILTRIGNRTLVQVRMHPDSTLAIFDRVFTGADTTRLFFDEALWLPQKPNSNCSECHGTGDLRQAINSFIDTRIMPGR